MLSDRSRFRPRESRLLRDCMRPSRGVAAEVLLVGFLGIILQFLCQLCFNARRPLNQQHTVARSVREPRVNLVFHSDSLTFNAFASQASRRVPDSTMPGPEIPWRLQIKGRGPAHALKPELSGLTTLGLHLKLRRIYGQNYQPLHPKAPKLPAAGGRASRWQARMCWSL